MRFIFISLSLSLLLFGSAAISKGCSSKQERISIFPTTNEVLRWDLKSEFFDGPDLTYKLSDPNIKQFKVINPIELTGADTTHKYPATNVVGAKVRVISKNGFWLNQFAFIDQTDAFVYLYISEGTDSSMSPQFQKRVQIAARNNGDLQCFDIEYLDTQNMIVDCQRKIVKEEQATLEDVFFTVNKEGNIQETKEKSLRYSNKKRFLSQVTFTNGVGITHRYLFRVTPSYSLSFDSELSNDSLIEVYLIRDDKTLQNTNFVLDKASLAYSLGLPSIDFSLVDYSVKPNGDIYLLDAFKGIYVVNFLPNGEWLVKDIIDPKLGQAYAFGINSLIKQDGTLAEVIVVQGYNYFVQIENKELLYIYDLPFSQLEYPAYIGVSQVNILIRNNNMLYLYNLDSDTVELNSKITIDPTDILLLNPYIPDLVRISKYSSKRYTLSMGYLQYIGSTDPKESQTIKIIATAQNKQECSVYITFQILKDRDPKIYQQESIVEPFPHVITENVNKQYLKQIASGPNLNYKLLPTLSGSSANVIVKSRWPLDIGSAQWPNDVVFADVLALQDQAKFYQILQTSDFRLQLWLCEHNSVYESQSSCQKIVEGINLGSVMTKQRFQLWRYNDQNLFFMYLDTDYSVTIKFYFAGELKTLKKISFDATAQNKIKSVFFAEEHFFIIKADDTILAYDTYSHETNILATIDAQSFTEYGYTGNWKPQKLFGNRKLHPNLIFIVHQDNIILVDFHHHFTFIYQFAFKSGLEVEIAIGEYTFFIAYGSQTVTDSKIDEYDFSRINNIFKTKTVQLYWYQIQSPLTVDQSEENGNMFVRAYCPYSQETYILVFQPDTLQHDCLQQAWSITNIPEGQKIFLSVDGDEQMFLYLKVGEKSTLTSVLDSPIMILTPTIDQPSYSSQIKLNLEVSNYNYTQEDLNTLKIQQIVSVINTQTKIIIDETKFTPAKSGISVNSNLQSKNIGFGMDWFTGQVTSFSIACEQCQSHIELADIIETTNSNMFNGYEIRDKVQFNEKYNILQATKGLIFTTVRDNTFVSAYNFDLPSATYKCVQAQVSDDKLIIYSLCQDKGEYAIYATGCISVTGCSPLGEKFKLGQASKIQLIENEVLIVLHGDSLQPEETDGTIVFYQIKMGLQKWNLQVLDVLTLQTINSKLTTHLDLFRPSDFTLIKQYVSQDDVVYKLLVSDSINGIIFYDFKLTNLLQYTFLGAESLILNDYLNHEGGQYAFFDTHYLQIRLTHEPIYDQSSKTLEVGLMIQTSNVAHYGLTFTFKQQQQNTIISQKQISYVLNRYGNWPSVNKLAYANGNIAIPYIHDDKILIGIYKITKNLQVPATVISAINIKFTEGEFISPLNMALFFNDAELFISEFSGPMKSYQIHDYPVLHVTNHLGDLKNQTISLILNNDFSKSEVRFKLEVKWIELHECQTIVSNIKIYPSTNEIFQWKLQPELFQGTGLRYTLSDNTDFSLIQPLLLLNEQQHGSIISEIVSVKAKTSKGVWTNHFAFLDAGRLANGLYFQSKPANPTTAPIFDKTIFLNPEVIGTICLDVEIFDGFFLVDCQVNNKKNILYATETQQKLVSSIESPFVINNYRWLAKYVIDKEYLVRVTPAFSYSDGSSLGTASLIEVFSVAEVKLLTTFDNKELAKLLKVEQIKFELVDFKIQNGKIYILDNANGLLIISYNFEDKLWVLDQQVTIPLPYLIAFDRNEYRNRDGGIIEHMVILSYNYFIVLENQIIVRIQDLDFFSGTYPQKISLSDKFVFVQNGDQTNMYYFDDDQITLIDQISTKTLIVNKNQLDLLAIGETNAQRFSFSQGLLKFQAKSQQQKQGELQVIAISTNNQVCTTTINYSIVPSNDATIYKTTDIEAPLPQFVNEMNNQIKLNDLASGPNLVYSFSEKTIAQLQEADFNAVIVQNRQINVSNWPKDAKLFQTSLVGNNMETLYQVFQTSDKKIVIKSCTLKDHVQYDCQDYGSVQIKEYINDQLFSIWQDSDNIIHFITIDTFYTIKFYSIPKTEIITDKTINLGDKEEQQIISLLNQGIYLFILQQNGDLSSYTINDKNDKQINIINGQTLSGFIGDWKPQKLYGNRILKQHLIFVQNENNIVLIGYPNDFVFLYKIDQIGQIIGGQNTFFIVNTNIIEYNYQNVNNIYQQKIVELFGYQITNQCTQQLSTGNLIIKTIKQDKIYLSIFKPGQLQHDTYYIAIPIEKANKDTELSLSASGPNYIITFVNSETVQQLNFILPQPELVIIPNKDNPKYISNFAAQIIVTNGNENNQIEFNQNIKIINTFTNIIDQVKEKEIQVNVTQNEAHFAIKNEYLGQISFSSLKLQNDTNSIEFDPFIEETKVSSEDVQNYKIHDGTSFVHPKTQETWDILQAQNAFFFVKDRKLITTYNYNGHVSGYACYKITQFQAQFYSLCSDGFHYLLQTFSCDEIPECHHSVMTVYNANYAAQAEAISLNIVIVLHTNLNHPDLYDGILTIKNLKTLQSVLTIDYEFISNQLGKEKLDNFRPSSFALVEITTGEFELIIVDSINGLLFVYIKYDDEKQTVEFKSLKYQLLTKWLNENNQNAYESTRYQQIKVIDSKITETNSVIQLLVTTNDSSSYIIDVKETIENTQTFKIRTVLVHYGNWQALNQITANKKMAAIPYTNGKVVTVGVYQFQENFTSDILTVNGAYQFAIKEGEEVTPYNFFLYDNTERLLTNSPYNKGIKAFQKNQQNTFKFANVSQLTNQTMELTFYNDFNHKVQSSFNLSIIPIPDKPDDDTKGLAMIWVVLIVLGSLVGLSLMGMFYYKTQAPKEEETLI